MKSPEDPDKRGKMIELLEQALTLSEELNDGVTGYLIERSIDQARSAFFRPMGQV